MDVPAILKALLHRKGLLPPVRREAPSGPEDAKIQDN